MKIRRTYKGRVTCIKLEENSKKPWVVHCRLENAARYDADYVYSFKGEPEFKVGDCFIVTTEIGEDEE